MRNFNTLAAVSVALLMAGGVSAKEKPDQPKPKKICHTEQVSGRVIGSRICRIVPPSEATERDDQSKSTREAGSGRH
ncbi:MAG: hypothetical protein QOJ91_2287 [Sphingomonadales bacterium]|jgi:hypothetical protein|nr:hypothetical protein [Sphingomonadales bacterium]